MLQSGSCRCDVCVIERSLLGELETESSVLRFKELCDSAPELRDHANPAALVAHIHGWRHSNGSGEKSDRVLGALRAMCFGEATQIPQGILVLAFIPVLHATVTTVASGFPSLARSDVAQQAFTSLVALLQSPEWLKRKTHLAFGLARELRRALFVWAKNEVRFSAGPTPHPSFEASISSADLFEHDVTLKHFLYRSLQVGALDAEDLDLLIQFKLEGDFGNGADEAASNALRQKMKRLVSKMRRRAAYKIAKGTKTFVHTKKPDTFSEFSPE